MWLHNMVTHGLNSGIQPLRHRPAPYSSNGKILKLEAYMLSSSLPFLSSFHCPSQEIGSPFQTTVTRHKSEPLKRNAPRTRESRLHYFQRKPQSYLQNSISFRYKIVSRVSNLSLSLESISYSLIYYNNYIKSFKCAVSSFIPKFDRFSVIFHSSYSTS